MLLIAHEPVDGADNLSAGQRVRLRRPTGLLSGAREIRTKDVKPRHSASRVNVAELRCQSKRQDV